MEKRKLYVEHSEAFIQSHETGLDYLEMAYQADCLVDVTEGCNGADD